MKITINGKQYTAVAYTSETTSYRFFLFPVQSTVVYCYDKEGKPHKFLATEILKYG